MEDLFFDLFLFGDDSKSRPPPSVINGASGFDIYFAFYYLNFARVPEWLLLVHVVKDSGVDPLDGSIESGARLEETISSFLSAKSGEFFATRRIESLNDPRDNISDIRVCEVALLDPQGIRDLIDVEPNHWH